VTALRFDDRVAIVTGAGRGLGRAYARLLAERGAHVIVNNRIRPGHEDRPPVAEAVVAEITAAGGSAVADTSDIAEPRSARGLVDVALKAFGRVDIVVNNAGIVHFYEFADYPADEFEQMLGIHVRAAWHINQAAWPHLRETGHGRIVNTTSRGAFFGDPHGAAYAATKAAMYGLTRALAVEGRADGIKVNALSPTAWTPLYARAPDVSAERRAVLQQEFKPEFVAPVLAALVHESCPFTGETIVGAGRHLSRIYAAQTRGADVGADLTPERFVARLPDVWDQEEAIAIGLVTPGARAQTTPEAEVPAEARRRTAGAAEVADRFLAAYNARDVDACEPLLAPDVRMIHHGRGVDLSGRKAVVASLRESLSSAFPDRRFLPERRRMVSGDRVLVEHTWEATPVLDVAGFGNAGEVVRLEVSTVLTVQDGLIVDCSEYG
jgi:NAD(P)-dependent dehydrogenase (short-subunit alcohol dehydrogenase family)